MLTLCMVGIVLFLLLPVPGMPIYLGPAVARVLLTQRKGADTFWSAVVMTVVVGMVIKLLAVALQQKHIGYPFSKVLPSRRRLVSKDQ
eukprot:6471443-Amphidinium_carterae.1